MPSPPGGAGRLLQGRREEGGRGRAAAAGLQARQRGSRERGPGRRPLRRRSPPSPGCGQDARARAGSRRGGGNQRHAQRFGAGNGLVGGRLARHEHGAAGPVRLEGHLAADAARDEQRLVVQGQAFEPGLADGLVHGVVAPDVLAHQQEARRAAVAQPAAVHALPRIAPRAAPAPLFHARKQRVGSEPGRRLQRRKDRRRAVAEPGGDHRRRSVPRLPQQGRTRAPGRGHAVQRHQDVGMLAADDAHLRCSLVGHDVRQAVAVGDDPFGKQVAHRQLPPGRTGFPG